MNHAHTRLNYTIGAQAWYAPRLDATNPPDHLIRDEIRIGRDAYRVAATQGPDDELVDDGCCWEFHIRQTRYPDGRPLGLRIEMFDDAWIALTECPDLFTRLAAMSNHHSRRRHQWTLADVIDVLDDLGFPRQHPADPVSARPADDPADFHVGRHRDTQGTHAANGAIQRAQYFAGMVRDHGPDAIGAYLDELTPDQHYALTTTLAAMIPLDVPVSDLLAWINDGPTLPITLPTNLPTNLEEPA